MEKTFFFLKKVSITNCNFPGFILLSFIDLNHLIGCTTGDEIRIAYSRLNIIKFAMFAEKGKN